MLLAPMSSKIACGPKGLRKPCSSKHEKLTDLASKTRKTVD